MICQKSERKMLTNCVVIATANGRCTAN